MPSREAAKAARRSLAKAGGGKHEGYGDPYHAESLSILCRRRSHLHAGDRALRDKTNSGEESARRFVEEPKVDFYPGGAPTFQLLHDPFSKRLADAPSPLGGIDRHMVEVSGVAGVRVERVAWRAFLGKTPTR